MIVPMKKVTVVLSEETRKASLKALRRAGVLHIERNSESGRAPAELNSESDRFESALLSLPDAKTADFDGPVDREEAGKQVGRILTLREREKEAWAEIAGFKKNLETLEPWGDFEPAEIRILAAKGVNLSLVELDEDQRREYRESDGVYFIPTGSGKSTTYGVAVGLGDDSSDVPEGISVPEYGITELKELIQARESEIASIEVELMSLSEQSGMLKAAFAQLKQEIEFEEVRDSLAEEEGLAWFTGYIPVEETDNLKKLAAGNAWGLMISDPAPDDVVPTLVRNNRAVRIIQPVFDLMGLYPGYHEADISFWFLLFLSMFVAMIFGDAAYGLIILGLVLIVRIVTRKPSDVLKLLTLFGLTTFAWGAATGTWFSSLPLVRDTPLKHLVVPAVATYQEELFPGYTVSMALFPGSDMDSDTLVKWLSLLFGGVMLSIARIQNFIRKMPSLAAIAQLGWLAIVVALYWLVMQMVLQLDPPSIITELMLPSIIGGFILVVLFGGQEKGRSVGQGILEGLKGLLPTALDTIGVFGNIISFIRLFAVGLAGVALSQSFNSMAPTGGGFSIILAVLILVFGHTLNFVLNALSVLVHGVRLNVLEFSGALEMEWAGIGFEPFRLKVPEAEFPETDKE